MSSVFLKNLFFNNISQGLQFGSRWFFNLILITVLSDVNFGIFAYAIALSNILIPILPFGSPVYLIGFVSPKNKNLILADSLAILISFSLVALFLYVCLLPFKIEYYHVLFYGLILGFLYALNTILYFYFKSLGKFLEEIKASFLSFILILIFIGYNFFFQNKITDVTLILVLLIFINLCVTLYLFLFSKYINVRKIFQNLKQSFQNLPNLIKARMYFGLQEIMGASYSQLGMFVLFYFLIEERYAAYRKMFIIIAPIYLLSVTFSQVLLHHLKNYYGKSVIIEFRKYQKYTIVGAIIVTALLYFFREFLLETLGKLNFTENINNAFIIVIIVCFVRFLYGNYEMLLVKIDKQKSRFWIMLIAGIANVLSIVILVPKFDLMGAVFTDIISNLVVLFGVMIISERTIRKSTQID
ncbi:polysaccharide biosynthesis C-terminal domain-containing protein [Aequorivita lipolytica]|uniref:Uncharacterized protein n=1 Tax=Aequorivita lipolytica TaxID=153267 RepID=A0A5C6YS26_9FLAO|nr:polysaccharide biosynthesis C-terminal domain-containing protein [Aequorivita lipolytica]TXD70280.1 hypothetical protein ESV24_03710 [Aequorivita lipolytica]SRX50707.1 hypothetical protein AEQU2_01183 [Aequorivita lipolytica]